MSHLTSGTHHFDQITFNGHTMTIPFTNSKGATMPLNYARLGHLPCRGRKEDTLDLEWFRAIGQALCNL